jgi:hypothetical protein
MRAARAAGRRPRRKRKLSPVASISYWISWRTGKVAAALVSSAPSASVLAVHESSPGYEPVTNSLPVCDFVLGSAQLPQERFERGLLQNLP